MGFALCALHTGRALAPQPPLLAASRARVHIAAALDGWDPKVLSAVVRELDSVPLFAIRLTSENTLYGAESGSMMYSQLPDVHRVLAQLSSTYPETSLEILPLGLGSTLEQAGILGDDQRSVDGESSPRANIIASPQELKNARSLGYKAQSNMPNGLDLPVFHIGDLEWHNRQDARSEILWPIFFRAVDVDALWAEAGSADAKPEVQVVCLGEVVERLRAHASGQPGSKPML
ncbi:MAG: hypothetical protein SGPRY_002946, partial [Prymnesium sp.]